MARPTSRKKSEMSKAVVELRTRLGDSQQAFSNRLGLAMNTVTRYETSREPSGEALLKLGNIAHANNLWDLGVFFYTHYLDDVLKDFPIPMVVIPATSPRTPPRGYLVLRPSGLQELRVALVFSALYDVSKRDDADVSKRARDLILEADKWAVEEMGLTAFSKQPKTKGRKEKK